MRTPTVELNLGESVVVSLTVHNYLATAMAPSYTLSANSPYVTITDGMQAGATLVDDGDATLAAAFAFTVQPDRAARHQAGSAARHHGDRLRRLPVRADRARAAVRDPRRQPDHRVADLRPVASAGSGSRAGSATRASGSPSKVGQTCCSRVPCCSAPGRPTCRMRHARAANAPTSHRSLGCRRSS